MNERVRETAPTERLDRVAADPLARDDRDARDARVGDANDRSGESAPYSLSESSGIGPRDLSPRTLRLRARRLAAASAAARWASAARSARSASPARRVAGSEPIGSAFSPPRPRAARRAALAPVARASCRRAASGTRDEPPDRGAGDGVPSADVGSRSRSRVRPAGDAADETLALAGVDARESPGPDETADVGRFFFFADPERAWSRRS